MFEQYKTYKCNDNISIHDLIDKYGDKYYINVEYKPNGTISLWFGSNKERNDKESAE